MISYEPRPVLKLTPGPGVADRRVQSYNFIEAVTKLPTNFRQTEVVGLLKRISPRLHDSLSLLFIVLNEDMVSKKKKQSPKKARSGTAAGCVAEAEVEVEDTDSSPQSDTSPSGSSRAGVRHGRKRAPPTPGSAPSAKK